MPNTGKSVQALKAGSDIGVNGNHCNTDMSLTLRQETTQVDSITMQKPRFLQLLFRSMAVVLPVSIALLGAEVIQAADYRNGIRIYAENCEYCHGPSGEGVGGMGELRAWDQLMKTDEELFAIVRDGKLAMPGYDGMLTSEEILDVIYYMRTFR